MAYSSPSSRSTSASSVMTSGGYLTRDGMKWFWDAYTSDPSQRSEKWVRAA